MKCYKITGIIGTVWFICLLIVSFKYYVPKERELEKVLCNVTEKDHEPSHDSEFPDHDYITMCYKGLYNKFRTNGDEDYNIGDLIPCYYNPKTDEIKYRHDSFLIGPIALIVLLVLLVICFYSCSIGYYCDKKKEEGYQTI